MQAAGRIFGKYASPTVLPLCQEISFRIHSLFLCLRFKNKSLYLLCGSKNLINMSTPAISPPVNREQVIFAVQDRWDRAAGKPTAKERRALLEQHREDQLRREKLVDQGLARELQHHYLATRLLLSFAFLAIFSWTVTCVLCYRPINVPSYYDQVRTVTKTQWDNNDRWRKAANVISTIVGSISIPVTSAICAKAAAVHCQRRSDGKPPPLSLRQTLALADKGWSDFGVLRSLLTPKTTHQTRSPLLLVSIGLVGLGQ